MSSRLHTSADRVAAAWTRHVAKATYKDYVERKKKDGEKPLAEDEWEAIVEGGGKGEDKKEQAKPRRAPTPDVEDLTKDDTGPVGDVVQAVKEKKSPAREMVEKAIAVVKERIESFGKDSEVSAKEQETTKDLHAWLKEFLGMEEEEKKLDVRAPALTDNHSKSREDGTKLPESQAKSLGEYAKALSDEGDEEPQGQKKKKKKTPAEIKRDFLKNVKDPDDRAAFEEMDEDEFMAALKSLMGKGKKGALRHQVVRLAYVRPDLRDILLVALWGS